MAAPANGVEFRFRHVETSEGFRQVEEVQVEAWGMTTEHPVPSVLQRAMEDNGGLILGAFDGDRLAGFSLGFLGREGSQLYHYSHMTAVRPAYRGRELGFRLKAYQREEALRQGLTEVRWTFDPLQSKNAFLNVRRLGARPQTYHVHYYGEMGSELNRGLASDRLRVHWDLMSPAVAERLHGRYPSVEEDRARWRASEPTVRSELGPSGVRRPTEVVRPMGSRVNVEIPFDLAALRARDPGLVASWRDATREAFLACLDARYQVEDLAILREGSEARTFYLLSSGGSGGGGPGAALTSAL
jgi:predicted GNAT superfamily acetyltransferase